MHFGPVAVLTAGLVAQTMWVAPSGASGTATTTTTTTPPVGPSTTTTVPRGPATTTTGPATTTTTRAPVLTASQELSDCMNAFVAQRAVTWTESFEYFGTKSVDVTHDGVKDGTFSASSDLGGTVARAGAVLRSNVYLTGNAAGFSQFFSFTKTGSAAAAGKWVSVPPSSRYFRSLAFRLTMATAVQYLALGRSPELLAPTTVRHQAVVAIRETGKVGKVSLDETVYIRAHGTPLPVEVLLSVGGYPATIVYSNWGVPPKADAPHRAVPLQAKWVG